MNNNFKFWNEVRIRGHNRDGTPREQIVHNTLTYAAADIMIAALLRSGPSQVSYLYAQHGGSTNTAPITLPNPMQTATITSFTRTIGGYDNGGLWIPILAAPAVDTTDALLYAGNLATYFFRIPGTLASNQFTGNFVAGTSLIYSLGLAVAKNANDRSTDVVISALGNGAFTPFVISPTGQEAIDYPLQITIPSS
jgi:hypothetical protein